MVKQKKQKIDPEKIRPQWRHPYLSGDWSQKLTKAELKAYAYDYFLRFLPFFRKQPEGSILPGVEITYSNRMRRRLGSADLFHHRIILNEGYFRADPRLLPYTLFHEMTHVWLYDCVLDPGHNERFYLKMSQFEATGLPVDPDVHIHQRIASETKFVYLCSGCSNRWYTNRISQKGLYCAFCFDNFGKRNFPDPFINPSRAEPRDRAAGVVPILERVALYEQLHGPEISSPNL